MSRKLIAVLLMIVILLLTACGGSQSVEKVVEKVTVEVPVTIEVTKEVQVTVIVTQEVIKKETVIVTATPKPAPTSTPTLEIAENESNTFAINELGVWDSGGISINVRRVMCSDKEIQNARNNGGFDILTSFDDTPVVCEIVYEVRNTTDKILSVYPDQGKIQIGDEVVDLMKFVFSSFGDDVSGDIPPGARLVGGQWFGVKRHSVDQITEMIWRFMGPMDQDFNKIGDDFEITLNLSQHRIDPLQDDLK